MQEHTQRETSVGRWFHEFALGALRTGGVLGAFLAFGLAWSIVVSPAPSASRAAYPAYAPGVSDDASSDLPPLLWLIDGYNVVCANLLGGRDRNNWWRSEYRVELLDRLEHFDDPSAELWVVFDGARPEETTADAAPRRVQTVYAPSADDWLLEQVKANVETRRVAIVTGDRKVADRARHRGAEIFEPRALLGKCTG